MSECLYFKSLMKGLLGHNSAKKISFHTNTTTSQLENLSQILKVRLLLYHLLFKVNLKINFLKFLNDVNYATEYSA